MLTTLEDARTLGRRWCLEDYGLRRHSRTQRRPLEHFQAEEQARLLPAPTTPYDTPVWNEPKVARDQLVVVWKALYSIPHPHVGQRLTARADSQIVRFYARGLLIKTHPRARGTLDRPQRLSARAQHLRLPQHRGPPAPGR